MSPTSAATELRTTIAASFPYLRFQIYPFDDSAVAGLISTSIRPTLYCPLNYARNYLVELLPRCVNKIVYLDLVLVLVLVDDIAKLAETPLVNDNCVGSTEVLQRQLHLLLHPDLLVEPLLSGVGGHITGGAYGPMIGRGKKSFPELGLTRNDVVEMSWIESVVYIGGFPLRHPSSDAAFRKTNFRELLQGEIGLREGAGVGEGAGGAVVLFLEEGGPLTI